MNFRPWMPFGDAVIGPASASTDAPSERPS